jgi:hypothetical protein
MQAPAPHRLNPAGRVALVLLVIVVLHPIILMAVWLVIVWQSGVPW